MSAAPYADIAARDLASHELARLLTASADAAAPALVDQFAGAALAGQRGPFHVGEVEIAAPLSDRSCWVVHADGVDLLCVEKVGEGSVTFMQWSFPPLHGAQCVEHVRVFESGETKTIMTIKPAKGSRLADFAGDAAFEVIGEPAKLGSVFDLLRRWARTPANV